MPSVKKNFIYNIAYQVLLLLLPLITAPYLSRVVGPSGLGTYSFTYSVSYYFVLFAMLGINNYGNRLIARLRSDKTKMSRSFWEVWTLQALLGLIAVFFYLLYSLNSSFGSIAFSWIFYVISSIFDINWFFFGLEEFKVTVGRNFLIKLFTFGLMFIVVRGEHAVFAYCMLISGSTLVSVLILWPFLRSRIIWVRPTIRGVTTHIVPNLVLFVPVVAVSLYTVLDKVMLGHMSTLEQTGFFENSLKVSQMPFTLVTALGTVMLPRMSNLIASGREGEGRRYLGVSMWLALGLSLAFSFGIAGVAPVLAPVYFGPGYQACVPVLCVLVLNMPFMAWANVLRTQYLIPKGMDRAYVLSVVVGAAVNVAANVALIPRLGALGAAWGTTLAEVAVCVVQVVEVRGMLPQRRWLGENLPFVAVGAAMFVAVRWLGSLMGLRVATLAAQVLVGGMLFALLSWAWLAASGNRYWLDFVLPMLKGTVSRFRRKA